MSVMASPLPNRCNFFLERKKRFCKMMVGKGQRFCGEHANAVSSRADARICTVAEDKLEKHLKKCNSRQKPKPVGFSPPSLHPSINTFNHFSIYYPSIIHLWSELELLLEKLKKASEGLQCEVEDNFLSHPALQEELVNPKNGDPAHKHLKQQASILGHLDELGLLRRGRCFVEFGAGRGKLSHWIHEALKNNGDLKGSEDLQLLLVERSSIRFKVDGKHQDAGVQFERLQVDIEHLDLSKVPLLQDKKFPLVGVGKHLCGAATDLALRCLLETSRLRDPETEPPQKRLKPSEPAAEATPGDSGACSGASVSPVLGLAVALCCHHRCEWRHFVGRQFFLERGLGAAEFSAFCRMSSWATCGVRAANQDYSSHHSTNQERAEEEHEPLDETDTMNKFLSAVEREKIGRLCKRLIDSGRCHFLKSQGFSSRLTCYTDQGVTLENVLLTAVPSSSSS
uniref:tRNA:m(4)X modification enzyme TRM13 n=1 Tax=Oryzias latipes TaxID=8090 RepID=H2LDW2_ORYLA